MSESTAWMNPPSLAYQVAFDLCAAEASCCEDQKVLLVSAPYYARELARRIAGELIIHPMAGWGLNDVDVKTALGPEVEWSCVSYSQDRAHLPSSSVSTILWAVPEKATLSDSLELLNRLLEPSGKLFILGETRWLHRFVPKNQSRSARSTCDPFVTVGAVSRGLKRAGWIVERTVGFQGPASLLWGAASWVPAALGRDDLVDRCFAASRQSLGVKVRQSQWSPIWIMTARLS